MQKGKEVAYAETRTPCCSSGRSQQTFIKLTDTLDEVTSYPVNSVLIFLTTKACFETVLFGFYSVNSIFRHKLHSNVSIFP